MTACTKGVKPGCNRKSKGCRSRSERRPFKKLKNAHFSRDRKVVVAGVPDKVLSIQLRGQSGVKCGKEISLSFMEDKRRHRVSSIRHSH